MSHTSRPVPAKRIFASLSEPHHRTREDDGVPYIGPLLDLRQLRVDQARQDVLRYLALASRARNTTMWDIYMDCAAACRKRLAGLKRSGGRVDWRGNPINN